MGTQGTNALENYYLVKKLYDVAKYSRKHGFHGTDDGAVSAVRNERPKRKMDDQLILQCLRKYVNPKFLIPGYIPTREDFEELEAEAKQLEARPYYVPGRLQEWRAQAYNGDPFEDWLIASPRSHRHPGSPSIQPVSLVRGKPPAVEAAIRQYYRIYGDEELGFSLDPHQVSLHQVHEPIIPAAEQFRRDDQELKEQERYITIRKRQAVREWHGSWASADEQEAKKSTPAVDPEFSYRAVTGKTVNGMVPLSVYEKEKLDDWKDWASPSDLVLYDKRIDGT